MNASIQRFSFTNLLGSEQVPLYPILFVIGMVFGFLL